MSNFKNPEKGKVYISPELEDIYGDDIRKRIVSKVLDNEEAYAFSDIKGERVIRLTSSAKTHIKATFHTDYRDIDVLTIQGYTVATDKPHNANFSFVGDEIEKLIQFANGIKEFRFKSKKGEVVDFADFVEPVISDENLFNLVEGRDNLIKQIVESDIRSEDLVAIGYRKKQLEYFEKMLTNQEYFDMIKRKKGCTTEAIWQKFFEKNTWIFGYGLGYIFMTNLEGKKLEQVVKGYDLQSFGKRADGVMKSRGAISNLCFIEIKTHDTKLLANKQYRKDCWAPSTEVSGALSQVRVTVDTAMRNLEQELRLTDDEGNPTDEELFNYKPKSYLVVGNLDEVITDYGVNKSKLKSFELFRNNISDIEIITFDELYERAKFIVANNLRY